MTNHLVGDVYAKIIEEVIDSSKDAFEENGVSQTTLTELQQEWQTKLSGRGVAQMPWDPKPAPPVQQAPHPASSLPSAAANGLPPSGYGYDPQTNGAGRIKTEPGTEPQYHAMPNGYQPNGPPTQGGYARAQQLVQQQYGNQQGMPRGGLALPNQKPQGLQMPAQNAQQQYSQQQQQMMRQQQAALQQQQAQPRIKVENSSPQLDQGAFQQQQQRQSNPAYAQTDGADEALEEWQASLAQRRAMHAQHGQQADRMMRDRIMQLSSDLQSGLMVPLNEQPNRSISKKRRLAPPQRSTSVGEGPSVPQLDGELDDEDVKPDIKDEEDDEDAINSDLDDSDEDPTGAINDDDEEIGDTLLCTYDKVQRVKNKWKCVLKDGVMNVNGKDWVFHKGNGEFEW